MMWLTWRRYRARVTALSVYVLALVVAMFITEQQVQSTIATCSHLAVAKALGTACPMASSRLQGRDNLVVLGVILVPIFIGLFFGAPLIAGEIETKSNRLTWTQGITRTRWLLRSWLTLAISAVVMMSALQLVVQWWAHHVYGILIAGSGWSIPSGLTGYVPVAIGVFALTFGVALGALVRSVSMSVAGTFIGLLVVTTAISVKVQGGLHPQPPWVAADIYLALSALLLGLSVWSLRRWRA